MPNRKSEWMALIEKHSQIKEPKGLKKDLCKSS